MLTPVAAGLPSGRDRDCKITSVVETCSATVSISTKNMQLWAGEINWPRANQRIATPDRALLRQILVLACIRVGPHIRPWLWKTP